MNDYFSTPGVSQSQLRDLARSPMHYYAKHVAKTAATEETPAMRFGSAFHAAVLEPEAFASRFAVADWDARTKAGKEARDAALAKGLTFVTADEAATIESMRMALNEHPEAARILASRSHVEHAMFWTDAETGIACKGKLDFVARLGGRTAIVDLKTTSDADPESFARSIANFAYHVQAAHYRDGWRTATGEEASFVFIAIEKSAPHAIGIYELDAEAIERGVAKRLALLDQLAECRSSNRWPGYAPQTISLPRWAA